MSAGEQRFEATFLLVRTPLLPWREFASWADGAAAPRALQNGSDLPASVERDRQRLHDALMHKFRQAELQEALFLASPSLEGLVRTQAFRAEPERLRARRALVRYFSRMASRATPFGACAGVTWAEFGAGTHLDLAPVSEYRLHVKLDGEFARSVVEERTKDPVHRAEELFFANSSAYRVGEKIRYVESAGSERRLAAVDDSDVLAAVQSRARGGARLADLAQLLEHQFETSPSEAADFLNDLVQNKLLLLGASFAMTGSMTREAVLRRLGHVSSTDGGALAAQLEQCLSRTGKYVLGDEDLTRRWKDLAEELNKSGFAAQSARLFQVDMIKPAAPAGLRLGPGVMAEVSRAVGLLHRLAPANQHEALTDFRRRFKERYDTREVPLVEALDDDLGVGFGAQEPRPLLEEVVPLSSGPTFPAWTHLHQHLLRLLVGASGAHANEVVLQEDDLLKMETREPQPLPDSFFVIGAIQAASASAIDRGEFLFAIDGALGPSGLRLLGRFCGLDPHALSHAREHARAEAALQPHAIFAEIVHLPNERSENVVHRPSLRDFEIPYLGVSDAPAEAKIEVSDLVLSVVSDRIVLRSARLNKEVIPRLSSAHDFSTGLPVYRFLCLLQTEGVSHSMQFNWGPLAAAPFLPRVRVGRIILSRAQWRVSGDHLKTWAQCSLADCFEAVQRFRAEHRLPRFVVFRDSDAGFVIDFDNVLSVDALVHSTRNLDEVVLVEALPEEELCLKGPEGGFVHELVIPMLCRRNASSPALRPHPEQGLRRFVPGSEWLYVKMYGGTVGLEKVLQEVVRPVARDALETKAVTDWFFVRYADPEWHLRVRFRGDRKRLLSEVLPRLEATTAKQASDLVWRIQVDTYEREVERYGGGPGIELAERIFSADSDAVIDALTALPPAEREQWRWVFALASIDQMLVDFGLPIIRRAALVSRLSDGFSNEMDPERHFTKGLGSRFRKFRGRIEQTLSAPGDAPGELRGALEALRIRSRRLEPLVEVFRGSVLTCGEDEFLGSVLHMNVNRVMRWNARWQEFVLYDQLTRAYRSVLARTR